MSNTEEWGVSTPEVVEYLKRKEQKRVETWPQRQKQMQEVSNDWRTYNTQVLEYDEKNKVALIEFDLDRASGAGEPRQLLDLSQKEPRVILEGDRTLEYKDGLVKVVQWDDEDLGTSKVFQLDENKELQALASFKEYRGYVALAEGGLFAVQKDRGEAINIYEVKQGKINNILTTDGFSYLTRLEYDQEEKKVVLSGEAYHDKDPENDYSEEYEEYEIKKCFNKGEDELTNIGIYHRFIYENGNDERDTEEPIGQDDPRMERDLFMGDFKLYSKWNTQCRDDGHSIKAMNLKTGQEEELYQGKVHYFDMSVKNNQLIIKDFDQARVTTWALNGEKFELIKEELTSVEELCSHRAYAKTKYGIQSFAGDGDDNYGVFIKNDGTRIPFNFGRNTGNCLSSITNNGLVFHKPMSGEAPFVYDFKKDCQRNDLEEVIPLGQNFYAAKKKGEKKFGIYEDGDEQMKTPLLTVDKVQPIHLGLRIDRDSSLALNNKSHGKKQEQRLIYENDGAKFMAVIHGNNRIEPVAKLDNGKLYVAKDNVWRQANLKKDTYMYLNHRDEEIVVSNPDSDLHLRLTPDKLKKLPLIESGEDKPVEKPREGYLNNKEILLQRARTVNSK